MRNIKILVSVIILLLSISQISCKKKIVNDTDNAISNTQRLITLVSQSYTDAQDAMNYNIKQIDKLNSVLNEEDIHIKNKPIPLVKNYNQKQNFFSIYLNILTEFNEYTDEEFTEKVGMLKEAFNSLGNKDETVIEKENQLSEYIKSAKVDKIKTVYYISDLVNSLYLKDIHSWAKYLDSAYNHFAWNIDQIPLEKFDIEQIRKYLIQPESEDILLVKEYKLNLKQDAYMEKSMFLDKAYQLSDISKELVELLDELNKTEKNQTKITATNTRILFQLNKISELKNK